MDTAAAIREAEPAGEEPGRRTGGPGRKRLGKLPRSAERRSFDRRVGSHLRARRLAIGVSQMQIAASAGISYQQIQKYETGANGLTLHRALQLAPLYRTTVEQLAALAESGGEQERRTQDELALLGVREDGRAENPRLRRAILHALRELGERELKLIRELARLLVLDGRGGSSDAADCGQ